MSAKIRDKFSNFQSFFNTFFFKKKASETSENSAEKSVNKLLLDMYFKSCPNLNTYGNTVANAIAIQDFIKGALKNNLESAFIEAASNGHQNILEAIIHSERFSEISIDGLGSVFIKVALNGHKSIVEAIIASERFSKISIVFLGSAFIKAASNGHKSIIEAIIGSKRFPEINRVFSRAASQGAASNGHKSIVEAIMHNDYTS